MRRLSLEKKSVRLLEEQILCFASGQDISIKENSSKSNTAARGESTAYYSNFFASNEFFLRMAIPQNAKQARLSGAELWVSQGGIKQNGENFYSKYLPLRSSRDKTKHA